MIRPLSFSAATLAGSLTLVLGLTQAIPAEAGELVETPSLQDRVAKGDLPDVTNRLPETPQVVALNGPDLSLGEHGGELHLLMGRQKDIRLMTVYGLCPAYRL